MGGRINAVRGEQAIAWLRKSHEESPGTAEQGCRLTAGGGDSRESATEINRPDPQREPGKDGKARQELTRGTGNFSAL